MADCPHPQPKGPALVSDPTPDGPSYAEENAMRIGAEQLSHYDQAADTYHCSYGPLIPAASIPDTERGILVRVDPHTRQVVGFTIPNFRQWYADNAQDNGEFEVELPPVWPNTEGDR